MSPKPPHPLRELALLLRDLCLFRRGPDDVPYSPSLLAILIAAGTLLDVAIGSVLGGARDILIRSLASTALVLGLCWIALSFRHVANRFVQTASAMVACSIVFSLLMLPLILLAGTPPEPPAALTPGQVMLGWGMLALIVWNVIVNAHIVRRALDAPLAMGLALAATWALADWAVGHALFDAAH